MVIVVLGSILKLIIGFCCVSWLLDARSKEAQLALNLFCNRDWPQTPALSCLRFPGLQVCSIMLNWYCSLNTSPPIYWLPELVYTSFFIVEKWNFSNWYNFINTSKMCLSIPVTCKWTGTSFLLWLKDKTVFLCWAGKPTTNIREPWNTRVASKCCSLQRQESYIPKRSKIKGCLRL